MLSLAGKYGLGEAIPKKWPRGSVRAKIREDEYPVVEDVDAYLQHSALILSIRGIGSG